MVSDLPAVSGFEGKRSTQCRVSQCRVSQSIFVGLSLSAQAGSINKFKTKKNLETSLHATAFWSTPPGIWSPLHTRRRRAFWVTGSGTGSGLLVGSAFGPLSICLPTLSSWMPLKLA